MPSLRVMMDVETTGFDVLKGVDPDDVIHLEEGARIEVGALAGGMVSGKPSVAFAFRLPDGKVVVAETSLALLLSTGDALKARYGDPR